MKRNSIYIIGGILIIIGILMAILPQFTNCGFGGNELPLANGKTTPMKCFFSGRAEIISGVILLAVGIMFLLSRRKETLMFLSILGLIASIFALLMPFYIIGICPTPTMVCETLMKPIIIILAAVSILDLIAGLVLAVKGSGDAQ
jgi:hypothetical protein